MSEPNVIKEEGIEQSIRERLSYSLEVGTVTTTAAGTQATAEIVGAGPVQTLNLTLPAGEQGPAGEDVGLEEAPVDGKQYVRQDANWAEVVIPEQGVEEAPINGKEYVRKNAGWQEVPTVPVVPPTKYFWSPMNVTNSFRKINGVGNEQYVDPEITEVSRDTATQVVTFKYTKPAGNFTPVVTASVYPRSTGNALHSEVVCLDWARSSSSSNEFIYRLKVLQFVPTIVDPRPVTQSVLIKMEFVPS